MKVSGLSGEYAIIKGDLLERHYYNAAYRLPAM